MTKEKYQTQLEFLQAQIHDLKNDYINAHKLCDADTLVEVKRRSGEIEKAIVTGFKITWIFEVEPILRKVRKDGTISNMGVRVWSGDKIIYPEKQNA